MRLETFCSENSWMVIWDCRIYFMKEVEITIYVIEREFVQKIVGW
jgi:hypothetical protein